MTVTCDTDRSVTGSFATVASVTDGFVILCLSVLPLLLDWLELQVDLPLVCFFTAGSVTGVSIIGGFVTFTSVSVTGSAVSGGLVSVTDGPATR